MKYVSSFLSITLLTAMAGLPAMARETSSQIATQQFEQLRGEARQVRSSALYIVRLTNQPNITWEELDRQWNMIKPEQDAMVDRVNMLGTVTKSMTPAQRQAYNAMQANVNRIAAETHELHVILNQQGVNLQSPRFKQLATNMARDASAVARGSDVVETASR